MEKYIVKLTQEERDELLALIKTGKKIAVAKSTHARILLAADEGVNEAKRKTDDQIAEELHVDPKTVKRIRKTCVMDGLENALERKAYTSEKRPKKIGGTEEAHLIAICCSTPPEGRCRWTLKLLADRMVTLEIIDNVSPSTVQRTLKKTS